MSNLIIKLGPQWARFSRSAVPGMCLLGTVQQDAGIGALARSSDGTYWQVNGDHRRQLNTSRVAWALSVAQRQGLTSAEDTPPRHSAPPLNPTPPTVTIKRKRVFAASEG